VVPLIKKSREPLRRALRNSWALYPTTRKDKVSSLPMERYRTLSLAWRGRKAFSQAWRG
jgi:hypothetical protein